jgi:hypothetical protein
MKKKLKNVKKTREQYEKKKSKSRIKNFVDTKAFYD